MKRAAGYILGFPFPNIVLTALVLSSPVWAGNSNPEFDQATGYRISRYRAPVAELVPGGTRVSIDDVERLIGKEQAILIDVMAAEGAGADPVTGQWRITKPREHIPGSHWLPDVGKGTFEPGLERYFKGNLENLTAGDQTRAIVIYCLADCWMGWNAAKRAASYGYTSVYWYPEGTDGWRDWDGPLVAAQPLPMNPADAARCVSRCAPEAS